MGTRFDKTPARIGGAIVGVIGGIGGALLGAKLFGFVGFLIGASVGFGLGWVIGLAGVAIIYLAIPVAVLYGIYVLFFK